MSADIGRQSSVYETVSWWACNLVVVSLGRKLHTVFLVYNSLLANRRHCRAVICVFINWDFPRWAFNLLVVSQFVAVWHAVDVGACGSFLQACVCVLCVFVVYMAIYWSYFTEPPDAPQVPSFINAWNLSLSRPSSTMPDRYMLWLLPTDESQQARNSCL